MAPACDISGLAQIYDGGALNSVDAGLLDLGANLDAQSADTGVDTRPDLGPAIVDVGVVDMGTPLNFPFVPSNVPPSELDRFEGNLLIDGNCIFDTSAQFWSAGCTDAPSPKEISQPGANDLLAFFLEILDVSSAGRLTITGARSVVFVVRDAATISGTIDVSAGSSAGPGGDDLGACSNAGDMLGYGFDGMVSILGRAAGGGGGGGYGGLGGTGGASPLALLMASPPGVRNGNRELIPLRGGCRGGDGGRVEVMLGGSGGGGGGALQITSGGVLWLDGRLLANGGGGTGGYRHGGGGGGGSGGALLLEANELLIAATALILANGGGGGGGGGDEDLALGASGSQSSEGLPGPPPGGDGGGGTGGMGGAGGALRSAAQGGGSSFDDRAGTGGGGGSPGRIRLRAIELCDLEARLNISPAPTYDGVTCTGD